MENQLDATYSYGDFKTMFRRPCVPTGVSYVSISIKQLCVPSGFPSPLADYGLSAVDAVKWLVNSTLEVLVKTSLKSNSHVELHPATHSCSLSNQHPLLTN